MIIDKFPKYISTKFNMSEYFARFIIVSLLMIFSIFLMFYLAHDFS